MPLRIPRYATVPLIGSAGDTTATGTLLDAMTTVGSRTISAGTLATEFDNEAGATCLRVNFTGANTLLTSPYTTPVDLSRARTISCWIKWNKATTGAADAFVRFFFSSGTTLVNWHAGDTFRLVPGWNYVTISVHRIPQDGTANYNGGSGWANKASTQAIGIRFFSGNVGDSVLITDLRAHQIAPFGVVLTADDNLRSTDTAIQAHAEPLGLKWTMYSVQGWATRRLGIDEQYMNEAELDAMYNRGHDISNHSWDHNLGTGATLQQALDQYGQNQDWLVGRGYIRNDCHKHVAYPFGFGEGIAGQGADQSGEANIRTAMAQLGVLSARGTDARGIAHTAPVITQYNRYQLATYYPRATSTNDEVDAAFRFAESTAALLYITCHGVSDSPTGVQCTNAVFKRICWNTWIRREARTANAYTASQAYQDYWLPISA